MPIKITISKYLVGIMLNFKRLKGEFEHQFKQLIIIKHF